MTKKFRSTIAAKAPAVVAVILLLALWQGVCALGVVPGSMLPAPTEVVRAFVSERALLWEHSLITLQEAFLGLFLGVAIGFDFVGSISIAANATGVSRVTASRTGGGGHYKYIIKYT